MEAIHKQKFSVQLALKLLQINAIKLNTENLFTWASGIKSPIYCDNRRTLAYPELRRNIRDSFSSLIQEKYPEVEYIAGVATGAIAHGALVADQLQLPYLYIRPKPKEHGLANQIEGVIDPGKKVVVVEDLISTGGSSLKAVEALRQAGFQVLGLVAIFTYGFQQAEEAFMKQNCPMITLTNFDVLLRTAMEHEFISLQQTDFLLQWRNQLNFETNV
ncbi:MAG TPA: orotate phosphoribosyltransferase [Salinivirgaceae bacterium]|nr:orotate phosphoribosyltransferase [Salinivirgaceae bacterium]